MPGTKDTRWQIHDLPSPEILAALGRVAARHGFLDHVLVRTIKTLRGLSIQEADTKYAREGSADLRRLVEKYAVERLGADHAVVALRALLGEAKVVTEQRNVYLHALWARDMNSEESLLIKGGSKLSPPSAQELDHLAEEIRSIAGLINGARLDGGFLLQAINASAPPQ